MPRAAPRGTNQGELCGSTVFTRFLQKEEFEGRLYAPTASRCLSLAAFSLIAKRSTMQKSPQALQACIKLVKTVQKGPWEGAPELEEAARAVCSRHAGAV